MINKTLAIVAAALLVLAVAGFALKVPATVTKGPKNPTLVIPEHAVQVADHVFDLGTAIVNGREARGYAILDYKEGHAKGGKGGGKPSGGSTCYSFIASGAKWKTTENYIVDTANTEGMSADFVNTAIDDAATSWNAEVPGIFGSNVAGIVDGVDEVQPDDKNEVMFGSIAEPGVIAVTIVWGYFSGPPRFRELLEWDQVYDQDDFDWGDATIDPSLMDLSNIAVHEVGHAAGMDHPESTCVDETMYAYATEGETKKRDLNAGDIAGVNSLY